MDIYSNPQLYDAIHQNYKWDKKLIQTYAKKSNGPVLELASGTGRLTQPIIEMGLGYTGLEASESFFDEANKKYHGKVKFVFGDMRDFSLGLKYNFIFMGFNAFLHNLTISDAKNCLECVKKHLNAGGQFLLSLFIPDPSFLYRDKCQLYPASDFFQFQNSKCRVMEKNQYDPESQINDLTWFVEKDGTIELEEYHFRMRMFYPHEMDILLSESGFIIKEKLGDYNNSPMDAESGMQIYVCEKY